MWQLDILNDQQRYIFKLIIPQQQFQMRQFEKMIPTDHLEDRINRFRQENRLVILWPDYEIYDLLDDRIPLEELYYYTTIAPLIVKIQSNLQTFSSPLDSKDYNHMAILKRLEINSELQKIEETYIILTKRAFAINKIELTQITHQQFKVTIQVMPLNNTDKFWGIQVKDQNKVMILGSRYISGIGTQTFHCQFQSRLRSLIFYSVQRKIIYGAGPPICKELPKDAKRQFCMKFKTYSDYFQRDRSPNYIRIYIEPSTNLFRVGNIEYSMKQKECKQSDKVQGNACIKIKYATVICNQTQQKTICISIPIQQSKFEPNQPLGYDISKDIEDKIKSLFEKIGRINKNVANTICQDLHESNCQKYEGILQQEKDLFDIEQMDWTQQRQILKLAFNKNVIPICTFIYSGAIQKIKRTIIERSFWLQLYQYSTLVHDHDFKRTARQYLKTYLIIHADRLLKESQQDIASFNLLSKFSLKECIVQSLELHRNNCLTVSDLLFLLMKLQDKRSIFELYQSYQLSTQVIIGESLNQWIQTHKLFHVIDSDFIYKQGYHIFNRERHKPFQNHHTKNQSNPPSQQEQETFPATISITRRNFTTNSFICSKKYQYGQNLYQVIVFSQQSSVMCLIEQSHDIFETKHTQSPNSFEIIIYLTLNQHQFKHKFKWCFLPPSQSVGYIFPFKNQIQTMKCTVSLKRDIIHQSIMTYFSIRFFDMLALPKREQQIEQNGSNTKIKKRTSSLFLQQNLQTHNLKGSMKEKCFLHNCCQECNRFVSKPSIYRLNFVDMYVLLKSAPFSNQNHAVLSLFKYLTLRVIGFTNEQLLLSIIRWEFINNNQLFMALNSIRTQEYMRKLQDNVVNKTLQTEGLCQPQKQKISIKTGRTYEQIWMYLPQRQFIEQFLKYKLRYKQK